MKTRTGIALAGLLALSFGLCAVPGEAQSLLRCGPFTQEAPTPPRPRENVPRILHRHEIAAVNPLISTCEGAARIRYADLGGLLLEPDGRLSPQISPDRLHLSAQGYARLVPSLDQLVDQLLAPR